MQKCSQFETLSDSSCLYPLRYVAPEIEGDETCLGKIRMKMLLNWREFLVDLAPLLKVLADGKIPDDSVLINQWKVQFDFRDDHTRRETMVTLVSRYPGEALVHCNANKDDDLYEVYTIGLNKLASKKQILLQFDSLLEKNKNEDLSNRRNCNQWLYSLEKYLSGKKAPTLAKEETGKSGDDPIYKAAKTRYTRDLKAVIALINCKLHLK